MVPEPATGRPGQQLAAPAAHPPTRFATSAPKEVTAPEEHQQGQEAKRASIDGNACLVAAGGSGETAVPPPSHLAGVKPCYKPELSSVSSQAGSLLQNLPSRNPMAFATLSCLEAPTRLKMKRTKPRRPAAIYLATHDRTQPPSDHRVRRTVHADTLHADTFLSLRELLSSLPLRAIFIQTPIGQVLAGAGAWCKTFVMYIHFLNDVLTVDLPPDYPGWLYVRDVIFMSVVVGCRP